MTQLIPNLGAYGYVAPQELIPVKSSAKFPFVLVLVMLMLVGLVLYLYFENTPEKKNPYPEVQ